MTKEEDFSIRMSELLFTMRSEDSSGCELSTDDGRTVPEQYRTKILDNKHHCTCIKERIKLDILLFFSQFLSSNQYDVDEDGNYQYSPDVYDHAYCMDIYIEEQYMKDYPVMSTRYYCEHCGSDNVQVKAWVKPNLGNKYVGEVHDDIIDCWCDDCDTHSRVKSKSMNVRTKVIGFQVHNHNGRMHPDISTNLCVYSKPQSVIMIVNKYPEYKLKAIYEDTIGSPIMMFKGDPRNPDEKV